MPYAVDLVELRPIRSQKLQPQYYYANGSQLYTAIVGLKTLWRWPTGSLAVLTWLPCSSMCSNRSRQDRDHPGFDVQATTSTSCSANVHWLTVRYSPPSSYLSESWSFHRYLTNDKWSHVSPCRRSMLRCSACAICDSSIIDRMLSVATRISQNSTGQCDAGILGSTTLGLQSCVQSVGLFDTRTPAIQPCFRSKLWCCCIGYASHSVLNSNWSRHSSKLPSSNQWNVYFNAAAYNLKKIKSIRAIKMRPAAQHSNILCKS